MCLPTRADPIHLHSVAVSMFVTLKMSLVHETKEYNILHEDAERVVSQSPDPSTWRTFPPLNLSLRCALGRGKRSNAMRLGLVEKHLNYVDLQEYLLLITLQLQRTTWETESLTQRHAAWRFLGRRREPAFSSGPWVRSSKRLFEGRGVVYIRKAGSHVIANHLSRCFLWELRKRRGRDSQGQGERWDDQGELHLFWR